MPLERAMSRHLLSAAALVLALVAAPPARAANTIQNFDEGASYFEGHLAFDGIGLSDLEMQWTVQGILGFGITDSISAYIGVTGTANEVFGAGTLTGNLGVFWNPLDTDHVDLDLLLDIGAGTRGFTLSPGIELNLDIKPERALTGLYIVMWESFTGRDESVKDNPATPYKDEAVSKFTLAPSTSLSLGTYLTLAERHQLHVVFDMTFRHNAASTEKANDVGGIALGYNIMLTDQIELINQVYLDIPQDSESFSVGLSVGVAKW